MMRSGVMAADGASGAAGAALGWKLIGGMAGLGTIGAALSALVVMCLTMPKRSGEWVVALVCTFVSSIGGGAAVVMHFQLQAWALDPIGLMALFGLVFTC